MNEIDDLGRLFSTTIVDDTNTLYINNDYIQIDDLEFICTIDCDFKAVLDSFPGIDPLLHESGELYWKMIYNGKTHALKYISRSENSSQYFEYYSNVKPDNDPDKFLYKYLEMFIE